MGQVTRTEGLVGNTAMKAPVRVLAIGNVTLSGLQTVDGVVLAAGDRVLCVGQTDTTQNGIYVVDTGSWERSADFDGVNDFAQGTLIFVNLGTTYASTLWKLTTAAPAIGSSLAFAQAGFTNSALATFIQGGTGAVSRTSQDKSRERVSVFDFMTAAQVTSVVTRVAPGTMAEKLAIAAAIQAADTYCAANAGQRTLFFPAGTYFIGNGATSGVTISSGNVWEGEGSPITTGGARGATLYYEGAGAAISADSVRAIGMKNLGVYCSGATYGIGIAGSWYGHFQGLCVTGTISSYSFYISSKVAFNSEGNLVEGCYCPNQIMAFIGAAGVELTTTTVLNCRTTGYSTNGANVTYINATAEGGLGSGAAVAFKFDGTLGVGPSRMISCDIEGGIAGDIGIQIVGGAKVVEWGTVWDGFGAAATRVSGLMYDQPIYGGSLNFIHSTYTLGSALNSTLTWSIGGANLVTEEVVINTTTDANRRTKRYNNGTELIQFEWKNYYILENQKNVANADTTIWTIPIGTNVGIELDMLVSGLETAAGSFSASRKAVAVNSGGVVTTTMATQLTIGAGGAAPVVTFTVSGTDILCQVRHGSATPTPINCQLTVRGAIVNYTKA